MSITASAIQRAQNEAGKNTSGGPKLAYDEAPEGLADKREKSEEQSLLTAIAVGVGLWVITLAFLVVWIKFFDGRVSIIHLLGGEVPAVTQNEIPALETNGPGEKLKTIAEAEFPELEKIAPEAQIDIAPVAAEPEPSATPEPTVIPEAGTRKGIVLDFTQKKTEQVAAVAEAPEQPAEIPEAAPVVTTKIKADTTAEIQVIPLADTPVSADDDQSEIKSFLNGLEVADSQKIGSAWVVRINGRFLAESAVIDKNLQLSIRSLSKDTLLVSDAKGRIYPVAIN